jgi:poly(hydroxyalkanoate) depolymerase family esterase
MWSAWAMTLASAATAATTTRVASFGSNPGMLRMFEYVPHNVRASPALVVALHGCTQSAVDYDREPGWSTLSDKWGFVLLLPQTDIFNHHELCFSWFNGDNLSDWLWPGSDQDRDRGQARSIKQMIDKAVVDHNVDKRRIYVTGFSAGGAMSAVMLATYPEVFAGGAIIAGVPYKCATTGDEAIHRCGVDAFKRETLVPIINLSPAEWGKRVRDATDYSGPWPRVSIWQGTADVKVNPANAKELAEQWTNVHGIRRAPAKNRVNGYPHEMYKNASGEVMVETYTITGMKHATPVDPGQRTDHCGVVGKYTPNVKICSSYYIGKFWGLDKAAP